MNCFWCPAPLTGAADTFGPPGQECCASCWYEWGRQMQEGGRLLSLVAEENRHLTEAILCRDRALNKYGVNDIAYTKSVWAMEVIQDCITRLQGELLTLTMLA